MALQKFHGQVTRSLVSAGSKSEHLAVQLTTPEMTYVLRRPGANAMQDPELKALVGKNIQATGVVKGQTLFVTDWEERG